MSAAQQKRVLVVDDDPAIRELLRSVLRRCDLIVDEAEDGAEALDLLKENSYSVILLDLLMPVVDGYTVIEKLDSMSSPVVLVITGAEHTALRQLDSRKIHGILRKPFDADELANLVVACAEIKSRSSFETMAISAMIASGPLLAWLHRF